MTPNSDGSYRIAVTAPNLQTASVGDPSTGSGQAIPRATFDPEAALDDPDLVALDIGHPLVRRLIEEVKQNAFRSGNPRGYPPTESREYGRTAYMVTPAADEITALIHILARYVVHTAPVSIIEELLPVAVPFAGGAPQWGAPARALEHAQPTAETLYAPDVLEDLQLVLEMEGLERLLQRAVDARLEELIAERRKLKQQMQAQGGEKLAWLEGIDEVVPASFDLLTVRLLYPAV